MGVEPTYIGETLDSRLIKKIRRQYPNYDSYVECGRNVHNLRWTVKLELNLTTEQLEEFLNE